MTKVVNRDFTSAGFERGATKAKEASWYLLKMLFFMGAFPWPSAIKCKILRVFGAKIGKRVTIKPRVNIHFPWKLCVGDDTWLGEQVEIYNFELVSIGSNACVSQQAFICAGNHNFRDPSMSYRNAPVIIEDGVWVGACCFVGPGIKVGEDVVIMAGSVVTKDLPTGMVCGGNPCTVRSFRWK